ncbi:hypothetical protein ERJ75_000476500 [Trypanosoma vivax]|nr:hypothetical protein ERJ75_000476500 [Trypanosoma vivax]
MPSAARFCVALLLVTVSHCVSAALYCTLKSSNKFTREEKCATRDLLFGWLNVTQAIIERATEVRKNATTIKNISKEIRKEGQTALSRAKQVLSALRSDSDGASAIHNIINDLNSVISRVDESECNATEAAEEANRSSEEASKSFGSISIAVKGILSWAKNSELTYEGTKLMIEHIKVDGEKCPDVYNATRVLGMHANELSKSMNLTAWKVEMLNLLQSTHDKVQSDNKTCRRTFTNENSEKLRNLKSLVNSAAKRLMVAVKKFDAAHAAKEKSQLEVDALTGEIESTEKTILTSMERYGKVLCDMLKQHAMLQAELKAVKQRLERAVQEAYAREGEATKVQMNVTHTNTRVQSIVDSVLAAYRSGSSSFPNAPLSLGSVKRARRSAAGALHASQRAVLISREARSTATATEGHLEKVEKALQSFMGKLKVMLSDLQLNAEDSTTESCYSGLSELLKKDQLYIVGFASQFDERAVHQANETLTELEAKVKATESSLHGINGKMEGASNSEARAKEFEREAVSAAEEAATEVLNNTLKRLCASATELNFLDRNSRSLSERSANVRAHVSLEAEHAGAALKDASGVAEMPQYVEEGFVVANGRVAVFEKVLRRADIPRRVVTTELEGVMRGTDERTEKHYRRVNVKLWEAFSNALERNFSNVCDASRVSKLLQVLRDGTGDVSLMSPSVITELAQFAVRIDKSLSNIRRVVERAAASADKAEAAVEEAIRRAHEELLMHRCTPIYKQLLGVLGRVW